MRCQRCGFEIEADQTFCSMCGTEQSKAIREKKKKSNSIWSKITKPTNHLKMWRNFVLTIGVLLYVLLSCNDSPIQVPYICLASLLLMYIIVQCLIPYKNPNASKSKKYKLGVKVCFVLIILLFLLVVISNDFTLMDLVKKLF